MSEIIETVLYIAKVGRPKGGKQTEEQKQMAKQQHYEYMRIWQQNNKDKCAEYNKDYEKANKDKVRDMRVAYNKTYREKQKLKNLL